MQSNTSFTLCSSAVLNSKSAQPQMQSSSASLNAGNVMPKYKAAQQFHSQKQLISKCKAAQASLILKQPSALS
jgi:hypothetical protein